jgi:hypothetical protein
MTRSYDYEAFRLEISVGSDVSSGHRKFVPTRPG